MLRSRAATALIGMLSLLVAAAVAGPVTAADLPPDVVTDGTATVTVTDPSASGAPLAGMTVVLHALRLDLADDPLIQELTGLTDTDGRVVFDEVARPLEGAPPVTLMATAEIEVTTDRCSQRWSGSGSVPAGLAVELPVAVDAGTGSCSDRPIEGRLVNGDGQPFPVAVAEAVITVDGAAPATQPVVVEADGAFTIWLGPDSLLADTTVVLSLESPILTVPGDPGCDLQVIERATATWEVPAGAAVPVQAVVSERTVIASTCGTTGTPAPPAAPSTTLPPTDGTIGSAVATSPTGAIIALLGVLFVVVGLTAEVRRRRA